MVLCRSVRLLVNVGVHLSVLFVPAIASAVTGHLVVAEAGRMDRLAALDNLPKTEFLSTLKRMDINTLKDIRNGLFDNAIRSNLVHQCDYLVERRNTTTRPATWKIAEDIWDLRTCVQMKKVVPRILLRSGKRSKQQFEAQREKTKEITDILTVGIGNAIENLDGDERGQPVDGQTDSELCGGMARDGVMVRGGVTEDDFVERLWCGGCKHSRTCGIGNVEGRDGGGGVGGMGISGLHARPDQQSWLLLPDTVAQATTMTEICQLKKSFQDLQVRVIDLEKSSQGNNFIGTTNSCYVYLRPYHMSLDSVNIESVARILGCSVLGLTCIKSHPHIVLKVRISKSTLHTALTSNAFGHHHV